MTRDAIAIHEGDTIHVEPHDIYAGWPTPVRHAPTDAVIVVAGVAQRGLVVVICWNGPGTQRGVVVYDWDAPVELVKAAA
jgi:hypothetical protein